MGQVQDDTDIVGLETKHTFRLKPLHYRISMVSFTMCALGGNHAKISSRKGIGGTLESGEGMGEGEECVD